MEPSLDRKAVHSARWRELAVCAVVALVAFTSGRFAYTNAPSVPHFFQAAFGPAVMVATGLGFVNPELIPGSELEQFLDMRVESIDKSETAAAALIAPDQFQHAHRYLLTAVGYWWRLAGISWSQIANVAGAIHVLAVLSVYALLRLFVPALAAVLGALWFCTTPLQFGYVPEFRDYAKGAFVLATVPLIVTLVLRARPGRHVIAVAAVTGAVIGLGFGFRMDVVVMLPLAVAVMVLFRGRRPWADPRDKALGAAVMVVAFVVVAGPILVRLTTGGSNVSHVILLGSGEWFDRGLRIDAAPYRLFPYYSDVYMSHILRSRGEVSSGQTIRMPSPEYERVGMELLGDVVRLLPGDAATRMIGSVNGILNLAFTNRDPRAVRQEFPLHALLRPAYAWLEGWHDRGVWLGALFVVVACGRSIRHGAFAATLLLLLAAYPSLQFDARHYFHLQAVPIVLIVVLASGAVSVLIGWRRQVVTAAESEPAPWRAQTVRMTAGAVMLAGITLVPVVALRAYQRHEVEKTFLAFLQEPGLRVDEEYQRLGDGDRWIARWPDMKGNPTPGGDVASAYYVVEFHAAEDHATLAAAVRYEPADGSCPRVLLLSAPPGGVSWMAFPVYSAAYGVAFDGLEVGRETKQRIAGIYRHDSGPAGLPLELRLPSDWQRGRLFQSLAFEGYSTELDVRIGANDFPCDAPLRYADAISNPSLTPTGESVDRTFTAAVTIDSAGVTMDGRPDPAYVVQFKPVTLAQGDALVASVVVMKGAVRIGLLKDGMWDRHVTVDRPGESVIAVPVTTRGTYQALVENAMPDARRSQFTIRRVGIVTKDGVPRGLPTSPANGAE